MPGPRSIEGVARNCMLAEAAPSTFAGAARMAAVVACGVVAVLPTNAAAATVSLEHGELRYAAAPGEVNRVALVAFSAVAEYR